MDEMPREESISAIVDELCRRAGSLGWTAVKDQTEQLAAAGSGLECLVRLAGALKDPRPLLELLARRSEDDLFHHRLCLAVRCADATTRPSAQQSTSTWISPPASELFAVTATIAEEMIGVWSNDPVLAEFEHFNQVLPMAAGLQACGTTGCGGDVNRSSESTPRVNLVAQWFGSGLGGDVWASASAARMLAKVGADRASGVGDKAVELLNSPDANARRFALQILVAMKDPALLPSILSPLLDQLDDSLRCYDAGRALAELGPLISQEKRCIDRLMTRLKASDVRTRDSAAIAIAGLSENAMREYGIVGSLASLLDQILKSQASSPDHIIEALGAAGPAAAEWPGVIEGLEYCVAAWRHFPRFVYAAVDAFGRLGNAAAAQPGLIHRLVDGLRSGEPYVGENRAMALCAIGEPVGRHPGVIDQLLCWARDGDDSTRALACRVLSKMGHHAVRRPETVAVLRTCLHNSSPYVCTLAVEALGELLDAGLAPAPVAAELLGCLENDQWHPKAPPRPIKGRSHSPRGSAIRCLGKLGDEAAQQPALIRQIRDALLRPDTCFDALHGLAALGRAAADPSTIARVVDIFRQGEEHLREQAAQTLARMGRLAVTVEVVGVLLEDLRSSNARRRSGAVKILAELMSGGARFHRSDQGVLEIRWPSNATPTTVRPPENNSSVG